MYRWVHGPLGNPTTGGWQSYRAWEKLQQRVIASPGLTAAAIKRTEERCDGRERGFGPAAVADRRGCALVDVLPEGEYGEAHLPGAINIPLKRLDAHTAQALDRGRPVIAYCWDSL
jgi:hypothetical protein